MTNGFEEFRRLVKKGIEENLTPSIIPRVSLDELTEETTLGDLDLDSITIYGAFMPIEERYGLEIPDDYLNDKEISLGKIWNYVRERI
ncbi:hypothetical protein GF386_02450 [Candidatus Pacearchaeota archaeon]|nr:hypothetical protein [Candidatus Pacearchaeota archaeon]MBD3283005.1 hypothetical protein [Candidatus Pacearchaeota archaeon]